MHIIWKAKHEGNTKYNTKTSRIAHKMLAGMLVFTLVFAGCADTTSGITESQSQNVQSRYDQSSRLLESTEAISKNEVIIAIDSEPTDGFDPTIGWGHGTTPLIQSALVQYTQDMQIANDLASDYIISDDGLIWTFILRKDAFFTDGEPVKASDVAFTFKTAQEKFSSLDLTCMVNCTATDDFEVTFTLNAPTSTFINTIATVGIVPEHAYSENYADNPIGSGPWKFLQWNKGEQVILEANEGYYGTVPAIKKATLVFMDEDAAFAAALAGQVDVALTSAVHATQDISGMHVETVTTLDNRGLTLPLTPADGETTADGRAVGNDVTSNLSIRQAIAYSIDREKLAKDAINGFGTPAFSENDGMPWNNPEVRLVSDIQKAKRILDDDGWEDSDGDGTLEKNGLKAEFTCIYPSGDSVRQAVAMAMAQQVREIGINIKVEGISWDEISKRMFSDAVLMGWGSSNPYTSYLLFHSDNKLRDDYYNPEGFSNEKVDSYLNAALHASSVDEANEQWKLAQWDGTTGTAMQGDCPWVWLLNIKHVYFVRDGLSISDQQLHAHGAGWSLVQNLRDWSWS